jgi:hypothetical protein
MSGTTPRDVEDRVTAAPAAAVAHARVAIAVIYPVARTAPSKNVNPGTKSLAAPLTELPFKRRGIVLRGSLGRS